MSWLAVFLLVVAPSVGAGERSEARRRPNILLILVDDQGYADLGCTEGSLVETPGIDRIATEGVRFRQAYVAAPMCSPSRAAILTGRYPERFGYFRNSQSKPGLSKDERLLPELLQDAGYTTGVIGKWHLGDSFTRQPLRRGFQSFFGFLGAWHSHYPYNVSGYPTSLQRDGETLRFRGYLNDVFTDETVAFLEANAEEEFFLYLSYGLVHLPLEAPPDWPADREDRRKTYLGMLRALDRSVGRILDSLDELGIAEDTLVLYLSDNGGGDGNGASNDPLRGYKLSLFEGGIRVPFLARWPGVLPAGSVVDEPVVAMDAFATSLAAAGIELPVDRKIDGRDFVPLVRGEVEGDFHPGLFWQIEPNRWAARVDGWKLIEEGGAKALFHLAEDPGETRDLFEEEPEVVARLERAFAGWGEDKVSPPDRMRKKKRRK